jgi:hypothetical protein
MQEHFQQLYQCWHTCVAAVLKDSKHAANSAMTGKQTWTKVHELFDHTTYILNRMFTSINNKVFHLL